MDKATKKVAIAELTERFSKATNFYLADASHLNVEQINKLRRLCFKQGVEFKVAKNTLIRKALESIGTGYDGLFEALQGPTSVMFSETGSIPAKVIKEFRKAGDKPKLKAAYIDSAIYLGDTSLDELAKLKTKHELIGEIIGLLQSPAKNVIGALQSGGHKLSGILKTLEDRPSN
jgi:large subunit ribosomal protein L10